jgi:major histocompatibility complex class I
MRKIPNKNIFKKRKKEQSKDLTISFRVHTQPGVVVHTFDPSTQEAEAGGFLSSRPA